MAQEAASCGGVAQSACEPDRQTANSGRAIRCRCWVPWLLVALGTTLVVDKHFKRGLKNGKVSSVCSW